MKRSNLPFIVILLEWYVSKIKCFHLSRRSIWCSLVNGCLYDFQGRKWLPFLCSLLQIFLRNSKVHCQLLNHIQISILCSTWLCHFWICLKTCLVICHFLTHFTNIYWECKFQTLFKLLENNTEKILYCHLFSEFIYVGF